MSGPTDIVLFDFGLLGFERASIEERLVGFDIFPTASVLLAQLQGRARFGAISLNPAVPPDRLVERLAPLDALERELIGVAVEGDDRPFASLVGDGFDPKHTIFVSADAARRSRALRERLRVSPHPAFVADVLDRQPLQLLRLSTREDDLEELAGGFTIMPILETRTRDGSDLLYVIATEAFAQNAPGILEPQVVGAANLVDANSLFLIQIPLEQLDGDDAVRAYVDGLRDAGLPLLEPTASGLLIAIPPGQTSQNFHPPPSASAHGHTRVLSPTRVVSRSTAVQRDFAGSRGPTDEELDVLDGFGRNTIVDLLQDWATRTGGSSDS